MPYSYGHFKQQIAEHILLWTTPETAILDVGAGCGTYAELLNKRRPIIDGIEIHQPYVEMFNLPALYRNLFVIDVLEFDLLDNYQYVIMGDVIEHLTVENAKIILSRIDALGLKMLVAVPYMFEQGTEYNNVYETHLQPDLTKDIFLERYEMMRFYCGDDHYGYFVNYLPW